MLSTRHNGNIPSERLTGVTSEQLTGVSGGEGPPLLLVHGWPQTPLSRRP
jgi:hypothetical protein